ncbi:MAG: glycosyl transferase family 2 [Bacteroidetes bacterium 4484_249]|nr:MAG: glycosyl transferase family 2 [Bacteroidetes bacterium 4484_249]
MLNNKTVAVVVPAYNEESQIGMVIETMPDYVDRIVIVNDLSKDNTSGIIESYFQKDENKTSLELKKKDRYSDKGIYGEADKVLWQQNRDEIKYFNPSEIVNKNQERERIILINHTKNGGVGAAIASGYKWCKDNEIDCTAVMAGDGQMDPDELKSICMPVVEEDIDYVKGNRLIHRSAKHIIPKQRFFGNSVLSILTKLASGYWHVSDTQTGYTAISLDGLNAIKLYDIYKRYGMPNDMLVKLNIAFCTLREVEIKPIYNVGEQSKMKVFKIIRPILWLLFKSFFKRLWQKYFFRDFHPLFLLYHFAFLLLILAIPFGIKLLSRIFAGQDANPVTVIAFALLFISGFQSLFFAMWMDIQDNERLYK